MRDICVVNVAILRYLESKANAKLSSIAMVLLLERQRWRDICIVNVIIIQSPILDYPSLPVLPPSEQPFPAANFSNNVNFEFYAAFRIRKENDPCSKAFSLMEKVNV